VHQLSQDQELLEVNLTTAPEYMTEGSGEVIQIKKVEVISDQEYRTEVIKEEHQVTTVTAVAAPDETAVVTATSQPGTPPPREAPPEPPLRYEPPPPVQQPISAAGPKKTKHVTIAFPKLGRRGHEEEVAHDSSGEAPRQPVDVYAPVTVTCYIRYLMRPIGILRVVQILIGIIVCAATNAEQCFPLGTVVCVAPSSRTWSDQLGGIGYVLFVGVLFILGNFAWILYHIYVKPRQPSQTRLYSSPFSVDDKAKLAELIYDGAAVILYIIASSVAAWYGSWTEFPSDYWNPYRAQWIAATIFAWINTGFYGFTLVYYSILNA